MKIIKKAFGSVFTWSKEYLISVLTTGKNPIITDPILINAINKIDRADFLPDNLKSQAYSDVELEIGYNEVISKPTIIAQTISILKPKFGGKYLDIGTGTGYLAMILAFVAGQEGHVYTIERVQYIWEKALTNSKKYQNLQNIDFLYRNGLEGLPAKAPFDGINVAFALESVPDVLKMQLSQNGGILVCPTLDMNLKVIKRKGLEEFEEEIIQGFVFYPGKLGIA